MTFDEAEEELARRYEDAKAKLAVAREAFREAKDALARAQSEETAAGNALAALIEVETTLDAHGDCPCKHDGVACPKFFGADR